MLFLCLLLLLKASVGWPRRWTSPFPCGTSRIMSRPSLPGWTQTGRDHHLYQGWEFIKEKKKTRKKENKNSYKKTRTKTRKKELVQESVHANKNSCKKTRTKTRTRTRKRPRKKELVQENTCFLVRVLVFFLACFLFFFYKFPAQASLVSCLLEAVNNLP